MFFFFHDFAVQNEKTVPASEETGVQCLGNKPGQVRSSLGGARGSPLKLAADAFWQPWGVTGYGWPVAITFTVLHGKKKCVGIMIERERRALSVAIKTLTLNYTPNESCKTWLKKVLHKKGKKKSTKFNLYRMKAILHI